MLKIQKPERFNLIPVISYCNDATKYYNCDKKSYNLTKYSEKVNYDILT